MRRNARLLRFFVVMFAVSSIIPMALQGQDQSVPELTDAEKEEFLLNGDIGRMREIGEGRANTRQATLNDGRLEHDAHVQTIEDDRRGTRTDIPGGVTELNFQDMYQFNIAAYRLDRLINLNMVPVSVKRRVLGDWAAVTWWVDDLQMMERERVQQGIHPTNMSEWNNQMYNVLLFHELVYNIDPHGGNQLITNDWQIQLVDFTRAFRTNKDLWRPDSFRPRVDRLVYEGLKALNEDRLTEVMEELLRPNQIRAILARRDVIVGLLDEAIATLGEEIVFRDFPRR